MSIPLPPDVPFGLVKGIDSEDAAAQLVAPAEKPVMDGGRKLVATCLIGLTIIVWVTMANRNTDIPTSMMVKIENPYANRVVAGPVPTKPGGHYDSEANEIVIRTSWPNTPATASMKAPVSRQALRVTFERALAKFDEHEFTSHQEHSHNNDPNESLVEAYWRPKGKINETNEKKIENWMIQNGFVNEPIIFWLQSNKATSSRAKFVEANHLAPKLNHPHVPHSR